MWLIEDFIYIDDVESEGFIYPILRRKRPNALDFSHYSGNKEILLDTKKCVFCNYKRIVTPIKYSYSIEQNRFYIYPINEEYFEAEDHSDFFIVNNLYEILEYKQLKEKGISYKLEYKKQIENWKNFLLRYRSDFFDNIKEKVNNIDYIFYGFNNVLIYKKHLYKDKYGELFPYTKKFMSKIELYYYYKTAFEYVKYLYNATNISYIFLFENHLKEAGASIYHMHKQIIGSFFWGNFIERLLKHLKEDKEYLEKRLEYLQKEDLIIYNQGKIFIYLPYGCKYPCIEILIYDKGEVFEVIERNFEDLIFSLRWIYSKLEWNIPYNEVFYYKPLGIEIEGFYPFFRIYLRVNTEAGFELASNYYSVIFDPKHLKEMLLSI